MGLIVIATYRPKPGHNDALMELVREHVPTLRRLGLATERTPIMMRAGDGTIVEVFEWMSQQAIDAAHKDPAVLAMWDRFAAVSDCIHFKDLPEAQEMFPGFEPVV